MQNQKLEQPLQAPFCSPLGEQVTEELRNFVVASELKDELTRVAENEEYAHAQRPEDLENGEAARRAIAAIGCASCLLADVCITGNTLREKAEQGKANAEKDAGHEAFMEDVVMFASAPPWLMAARINRTGAEGNSLLKTLESPNEAEKLHAAGQLPVEHVLGNVKNHIDNEVTKKDIPVLAQMSKISPDARLAIHDIETTAGKYKVIDASEAINFTGQALDAQSYGILVNKFLARMEQTDNAGNPQIFQADNKMQKVVTRRGNATLFEMRMSGKNRMYFWATHEPDQVPEIVIIGSHGGDTKTQKDFLNNYADVPQYK